MEDFPLTCPRSTLVAAKEAFGGIPLAGKLESNHKNREDYLFLVPWSPFGSSTKGRWPKIEPFLSSQLFCGAIEAVKWELGLS